MIKLEISRQLTGCANNLLSGHSDFYLFIYLFILVCLVSNSFEIKAINLLITKRNKTEGTFFLFLSEWKLHKIIIAVQLATRKRNVHI